MAEQLKIVPGYYQERINSKIGTGDTAKAAEMINYWRLTQREDGAIIAELLDNNDQPSGYREEVPPEELSNRFVYQENFKPQKVDPKVQQAERITARAERHLQDNEYMSAEFEFSNALKFDEENVRANFGLGKTFLATGEVDKAKDTFKKLVDIDAITDPQHKHIFNDFGIQLRKLGMYGEAVRHYGRALEISRDDENLWFNLGRALFDAGQSQKAVQAFSKALSLNPDLEEAKALLFAARKNC